MARPVTAHARTTDLIDAVDRYARDGLRLVPADHAATRGELLALRWACEALDKVLRTSPLTGELLEHYAAQMVAALDLTEEES